jgi:hypothetical protein
VLRAEGTTGLATYRLADREEDLLPDLFLDWVGYPAVWQRPGAAYATGQQHSVANSMLNDEVICLDEALRIAPG